VSPGRPPDAWRATLAELATRDATLQHIAAVLNAGPEHPHFFRALGYATDHGCGKATQPLALGDADGQPITIVLHVPEPDEPFTPHLATRVTTLPEDTTR
jgi:hypothetical protein